MASQDLGALGAREGPALAVNSPVGDSLRSVAGWFMVIFLLLVRKVNRSPEGWKLLLPLLAVYALLGVAERGLNAYFLFNMHQYLCTAFADLFRFFSLSLAVVLAIGDRLTMPWRLLRFVIVLLLLFMGNNLQIASNAWPMLHAGAWTAIFGVVLLVFMLGHSLMHATLRRCFKSGRFRWGYGGFCLCFGMAPLFILGIVEFFLSRSQQLQSTYELYRMVVVITAAITLPWAVWFWFVLLAANSALYAQRVAGAFGVTRLSREIAPIKAEAALPPANTCRSGCRLGETRTSLHSSPG